MAAVMRFFYDIEFDTWQMCISWQMQISHLTLIGKNAILFYYDVDFLIIVGMLQASLMQESITLHWF